MENKILYIKSALSALFVVVGDMFSWQMKLVLLMIAMMIIDFITGTIAGALTVGLSSKIMRKGVATKLGYIFVIIASALCDYTMSIFAENISANWQWETIFVPMACGWYIVTDGISILENVVNMGAPVPDWLVKKLRITKDKIDNTAKEDISE